MAGTCPVLFEDDGGVRIHYEMVDDERHEFVKRLYQLYRVRARWADEDRRSTLFWLEIMGNGSARTMNVGVAATDLGDFRAGLCGFLDACRLAIEDCEGAA